MKRSLGIAIVFILACAFLLSGCMSEEDYYKKEEIDSSVSELQTELEAKSKEYNYHLDALKNEYSQKIAVLETEEQANKAAIEALTTTYNAKVTELEAADKATNDELAALKTKYDADLLLLQKADKDNADEIDALTATYEAKVAELEAADKATNDELATLKTKYDADLLVLQKADEDNADEIDALTATYEAKVAELEAADKATNDELAALKTKYDADLLTLQQKDAEIVADLLSCENELQSKIDELSSAHRVAMAEINAELAELKNEGEEQAKKILALEKELASISKDQGDKIAKLEEELEDVKTPITHTVTFNPNNGENSFTEEVTHASSLPAPKDPTAPEYHWDFQGWYLNGEKWNFNKDIVSRSITLEARWYVDDGTEAPTEDVGGEDGPALDEFENPVLYHTPVLDGVLDDEYLLSYHFDCPQYSETVPGYEDQPNAFSNRATVYTLWDGAYVYFAVELYDDDMIARDPAYLIWQDKVGDTNPYYNDSAEIWFCFEGYEPESITDVRKLSYDAYGNGEGPFSAIYQGIYSNHFMQSAAAAKAEIGYDPDDEEGFCDRSVIELKIPAKTESSSELYEGDPIYFSVQINDIAKATAEELTEAGLDPDNLDPTVMEGIGTGYTFTYSRAAQQHFPKDGELNGYAMGTLTDIPAAAFTAQ